MIFQLKLIDSFEITTQLHEKRSTCGLSYVWFLCFWVIFWTLTLIKRGSKEEKKEGERKAIQLRNFLYSSR